MATSPAESRKGNRSGMMRRALGESFETNSRKGNDQTAKEEPSGYENVLITGVGYTAAKLPRSKKSFKLKAKHNQSRQDITDLVSRLPIYFVRLLSCSEAILQGLQNQR